MAQDGAATTFANARAAKMSYDARLAKLEYEKASGKLVETDEVRAVAANAGAILRNHLERLPDQLAPELAVESSEDRIHALLVENVEHALQQVSQAITNGIEEAANAD